MRNIGFKRVIMGNLYDGVDAPIFPLDGLVAAYELNIDGVDSHNNNHSTETSVTHTDDGVITGSATLGTRSFISMPIADVFNHSFSLSCWIKNVQLGGGSYAQVFGTRESGTSSVSGIRWNLPNFSLFHQGSGYGVNTGVDINIDMWQHVVVTFDTTTGNLKAYNNGTLNHERTEPGLIRAVLHGLGDARFGYYDNAGYGDCAFQVDEVFIWNKVISPQDVHSLYNNGAAIKYSTTTGFIPPSTAYDDLTAYYKLDEETGVAIDQVNGNSGTVMGAVQNQEGKLHKSYLFNASLARIVIPDQDYLSFTDGTDDKPFSIGAWINISDASRHNHMIINKLDAAREWYLFIIDFNLRFYLEGAGGSAQIETVGFTFEQDTWYYVAATYDGSKSIAGAKIYINGQLITTTATSSGFNGLRSGSDPVVIGAHGNQSSDVDFKGRIDEISIWSKELTQSHVTYLYNNGFGKTYGGTIPYVLVQVPPPTFPTQNLISYYRLNEMSGDAIDHISGFNASNSGADYTGDGYTFDIADYLSIPDSTAFNMEVDGVKKNFGMRLLVSFNSFNTTEGVWFANRRKATNAAYQEWQFYYYQGKIRMSIWNTDGSTFTIDNTPFTFELNRLYQIVFSIDFNDPLKPLKIFIDGTDIGGDQVGTIGSLVVTRQPTIINQRGWSTGSSGSLTGTESDIAFWSGYAPTLKDAQLMWNNGNPVKL